MYSCFQGRILGLLLSVIKNFKELTLQFFLWWNIEKNFPDKAVFEIGSFFLFLFSLKQILSSEPKHLSRYQLLVYCLWLICKYFCCHLFKNYHIKRLSNVYYSILVKLLKFFFALPLLCAEILWKSSNLVKL